MLCLPEWIQIKIIQSHIVIIVLFFLFWNQTFFYCVFCRRHYNEIRGQCCVNWASLSMTKWKANCEFHDKFWSSFCLKWINLKWVLWKESNAFCHKTFQFAKLSQFDFSEKGNNSCFLLKRFLLKMISIFCRSPDMLLQRSSAWDLQHLGQQNCDREEARNYLGKYDDKHAAYFQNMNEYFKAKYQSYCKLINLKIPIDHLYQIRQKCVGLIKRKLSSMDVLEMNRMQGANSGT